MNDNNNKYNDILIHNNKIIFLNMLFIIYNCLFKNVNSVNRLKIKQYNKYKYNN